MLPARAWFVARVYLPAVLVLTAACGGNGDDTTDKPDTGGTPTVPKAPSNLKVIEVSGGGHMTWKDNSDNEDTFEIMRNGEIVKSLPFDTTQYHDSDITKGKTYKYMVHASNEAGQSASDEVAFTLP